MPLAAYRSLPTTYCLLFTAYCLLLTSYDEDCDGFLCAEELATLMDEVPHTESCTSVALLDADKPGVERRCRGVRRLQWLWHSSSYPTQQRVPHPLRVAFAFASRSLRHTNSPR